MGTIFLVILGVRHFSLLLYTLAYLYIRIVMSAMNNVARIAEMHQYDYWGERERWTLS